MSEQSHPGEAGRRRRWPALVAVAVVAAFTGAAATGAVGQWAPGWGHHGWGPGLMRGPMSPAQIEERVDRGIRHAAIELDATLEQQDKLRAIAKAAVKDLLPMGEKARAARERAVELLIQPKVDRAALEAFRAEQMALADAASKRLAQAVGDAAEVLTPEQRQKAHELVRWRRGFMRGWHRG
ncbi:MAG TPA: periplasmic heavy metal sensor [Hyphomicrobiaceae bacterium]|nr:periplasmic heavy metal sensor [Hyphomicrobiaceae bacterium]